MEWRNAINRNKEVIGCSYSSNHWRSITWVSYF